MVKPVDSQNFAILIAEDEELNYLLLEKVLKIKKYKLFRAKNGKEAVELCRQHIGIGLVLMDMKMPEMNGYDATKIIKSERPELPVIAQTAYALPEEIEKAYEVGCEDYLAKPISLKELTDKVDGYAGKSLTGG
jgi:two-component system cell cycle response regulator DivK